MKPILILGANGQLGRSWCEHLDELGIEYEAFGRDRLALGDPNAMATLRAAGPRELIVNCAAYTAVDKAETEHVEAERINGTAVGELAECAKQLGARLIHYSTDYVFNGDADTPYPVDAPIDPVNAYGRSKALGESLLAQSGARVLLIRTSWVYAPWGKNFVLTMARLLKEKPELRVVSDQRGRPSSALQLAQRSFSLSRQADHGTFHLADAGDCSWHDFATAIRDRLELTTPVHPIPTRDFPTPAKRPGYSVLDTSAADDLIGPAKHWRLALDDVLDRWLAEQPNP